MRDRCSRVQARWERRNAARADLVVVTSRYSAEVARREYGVPAERLAVVPEPIDLDGLGRRVRRGPPAAARHGPVVLSVARMYPRKRLDDLLHAAALLRTRIPGVQVRIVGRGSGVGRARPRCTRSSGWATRSSSWAT